MTACLHQNIKPYIFSTIVDCHLSGGTLINEMNSNNYSHKLGPNIFTKAITSEEDTIIIQLPSDGRWVDFWTGQIYDGSSILSMSYPLDKFPLFIKSGSIIPLDVTNDITGLGDTTMIGRTVIKIWPDGHSAQTLHLPLGEGVEYADCTVVFDNSSGILEANSEKCFNYTFIFANDPTLRFDAIGQHVVIHTNCSCR